MDFTDNFQARSANNEVNLRHSSHSYTPTKRLFSFAKSLLPRRAAFLCAFAVLFIAVAGVWGQEDYTWNKGSDGSWNNESNWDPNEVPGGDPDDTATINDNVIVSDLGPTNGGIAANLAIQSLRVATSRVVEPFGKLRRCVAYQDRGTVYTNRSYGATSLNRKVRYHSGRNKRARLGFVARDAMS